jgi:predicted transcriptional regulator
MHETKPKRVIPVYLEPEQIEWLEQRAKRNDRKKGYYVREAVAEKMAREAAQGAKVGR